MFPVTRLRRLRQTPELRKLLVENEWNFGDLVVPCFVVEGSARREAVAAMPGVFRLSLDNLLTELAEPLYRAVGGILLFGIPAAKDATGSAAWQSNGIVQQACRAIKQAFPELVVITDVCLCSYTSHGHCGLISAGKIANDPTVELLSRVAVSHCAAGADLVAPADMMDGRVAAIRRALDENGFADRMILSYGAKFASAFYGPFREAADSAPQFGDRKSYQLPPANRREALRELAEDLAEGADLLLIKPGLPYLDLIREARERFDVPLVVYNVSGEYAMIKAAAANGWIDEAPVVEEVMTGFKRAGADLIITYHARDLYRWRGKTP